MPSGDGSSLGRALVAALADAAGGTVGVRSSYTAKGWHAQISKLTSSPRGYEAAEKAGLSVTRETLTKWLAEEVEPKPSNQALIAKAYAIAAGRWPEEIETARSVKVTGKISTGADDRRQARTVDLINVDGDWTRLREAWEANDVDADDFEEMFIEDVWEAEMGDGSDGWDFNGSSYTVAF